MNAVSSYKPDSANNTVPTVTKSTQQKPKQRRHQLLPRYSKGLKHPTSAVRAASKILRHKSLNKGSRVIRRVDHREHLTDSRKVTKPKQRRRRQHIDHVESLIDGLTDYFTAHGERRLKSPALKSISSYGSESPQATSSHQLHSPTETSVYTSQFSHGLPRKQKKATVEKLFDGLSTFFAVQNEHRRRQPTSPIPSSSQETVVKNDALMEGRTSAETKLSELMSMPIKEVDRKMMAIKTSQLKGLFDGLSHLYSAHGDRKRKSPFFYTVESNKSNAVANQRPASPVKQESVGAAAEVLDTSPATQTVKAAKEKQHRMPSKLSTNKLQLSKKSAKPLQPVTKKQPSSSGMLL